MGCILEAISLVWVERDGGLLPSLVAPAVPGIVGLVGPRGQIKTAGSTPISFCAFIAALHLRSMITIKSGHHLFLRPDKIKAWRSAMTGFAEYRKTSRKLEPYVNS